MYRNISTLAAAMSLTALFTTIHNPILAQAPAGGAGGFAALMPMARQMFSGMMPGAQGRTSAADPSITDVLLLIKREDVQADILLSSPQRQKLESFDQEIQKEQRNQMTQIFSQFGQMRNMTAEERTAKMQEFQDQAPNMAKQFQTSREDQIKRLEKLLNAKQIARLHELDLRWRGPLALKDEKVASAMKLDKADIEKVNVIYAEHVKFQTETMTSVFTGMRGGGRPAGGAAANGGANTPAGGATGFQAGNFAQIRPKMEEAQKKVEKARKVSEAKLLASLTPEQNKSWETLLGRKFTFRIYAPPQQL